MQDYLFLAHPLWTAAFWISMLAFFGLGAWMGRRERSLARGENRDRGSRMAIYLLSICGMALAFAVASAVPSARIMLPSEAVFGAAMICFWGGFALYFWSVTTLGHAFRTSVTLLDDHQLITRGPYRLLRHPAYTGGILIFAGIGLAIGNWLSVVGAVVFVLAGYLLRIRVEEAALRERFGAAFDAHAGRTWKIIPLVF